jgi:hypothetical protein
MSNIEWNQLLNNLCAAEAAGVDQCLQLSSWFRDNGYEAHADEYQVLAQEEAQHTLLASQPCLEERAPAPLAKAAYGGALLSPHAGVAERLVILHMAFEPFALSFMSAVYMHMQAHLDAAEHREWVQRARESLGPIIRDEVRHVRDGGHVARAFFARASLAEQHTIGASLKRHRKFLLLGARVSERHTEQERWFLRGVQQTFERRFDTGLRALEQS